MYFYSKQTDQVFFTTEEDREATFKCLRALHHDVDRFVEVDEAFVAEYSTRKAQTLQEPKDASTDPTTPA